VAKPTKHPVAKGLDFSTVLLGSVPSGSGVSKSKCSEGQMRTCKVTRGPRYDADVTIVGETLLETTFTSYFLLKVS